MFDDDWVVFEIKKKMTFYTSMFILNTEKSPWLAFPNAWSFVWFDHHDMPVYIADNFRLAWDDEYRRWTITFTPNHVEVCYGCENRLHPTTTDTWKYISDLDQDGNYIYETLDIGFKHETLKSSECNPWDMRMLGLDFFEYRKITFVVWFVCPVQGIVYHSGAKCFHGTKHPGKRYCGSCKQCYSANNFKTQHLTSAFHCNNVWHGENELKDISLDEFIICVQDVLL